jgi:hypothetical protein
MAEALFGKENIEDHLGLAIQTSQLVLGEGTKTASATTGAATLNQPSGVVTSESLTTAAAATYTLTLTNSKIAATDIVLVSVGNGTNSAGAPVLTSVKPAAGSVVIKVTNLHASAALNGTLVVSFVVVKV